MRTKGKWEVSTSGHRMMSGGNVDVDQVTTYRITTQEEKTFIGKHIANIDVALPSKLFEDGSLAEMSNNCKYKPVDAKANAEFICTAVNTYDNHVEIIERLLEAYCNMAQQLQSEFQFTGDQLTQRAEVALKIAKETK